MDRQNISSGTPWESLYGYSRAVRIGNRILLSGTIAVNESGILQHPNDPRGQTNRILDKISAALREAGAGLVDIIQLRISTTHLDHADAIGRSFNKRLGDTRPVSTMDVVAKLFADALVEIEAEAFIQS